MLVQQMQEPSFWQNILQKLRLRPSTYNPKALVPLDYENWDNYENRLFRYQHYHHYFHNVAYRDLLVRYAASQREKQKLYRHIRSIYNPVGRVVKLYKSQVYGGVIDYQNASDGAIPIVADENTKQAILQLWRWSDMQAQKNVLIHDGTLNGDAFIKVVDDPIQARVRLQVMEPSWVMDMVKDPAGNITEILIAYLQRDEHDKEYVYGEYISRTEFVTFRDGVEYAYQTSMSGELVSRWANKYGFVPVVHIPHYDIGNVYGATPFEDTLSKIDEINDYASNLNDNTRKTVTATWAFSGVASKKDISESDPGRDSVKALYLPDGATASALVAPLDITGALAVLVEMLDELDEDMPELTLSKLSSLGTLPSGTALQTMFQSGAKRIQEAQGNYNAGLIRAQQQALVIGGRNRYKNFEGLGNLELDDPQHSIKLTPIFPDELSKKERIDTLLAGEFPPELILDEMGYSEEEIKEILKQMAIRDAAAVRGLLADVMQNPQAATNTPIGQAPQNILAGNPAIAQLPEVTSGEDI